MFLRTSRKNMQKGFGEVNSRRKSRLCAVSVSFAVLVYCMLLIGGNAVWAAPYVIPWGKPTSADKTGATIVGQVQNRVQSGTVTSVTYSVYQPKVMQIQASVPAPTNLKVISRASDAVTLKWSEPTVTAGVYGYHIYNGNVLLGGIGAEYSAVNVNGLMPNTVYSFVVKAVDGLGNESSPSNKVVILLNGSLHYNYDSAGRLQSITIQQTGQTIQSYVYDDNGNLLNVIIP
ncbi:fibronectin type III domain-containing protein [Paenibacillus whitsoniae]|uniref:Fibronectin type III domain-containing protein n=1 Tax=Paenibacillus whitsoniae TaxID=2496558 RepID=A0A3S0A6E2_9BACL|nr:fibronectin type III domain-containing protein [Paenibacillus whitsoniae]RTE10630.1 fibronectin type III domain-containing protein [Paenibacillus whitsoniae]